MVNIQLVEELRLSHGYNQEQLAVKMGYNNKSTYNCKIKGSRQFTIYDVVKLCEIFQLEPNDLIIID